MLKFNKNVEERKTIAHRLGELTGIQPFYTRAPLYTYEVGPYVIDRNGDLLVDENQADPEVLTALMSEGLITGGEVVGTDAPVDEGEFPAIKWFFHHNVHDHLALSLQHIWFDIDLLLSAPDGNMHIPKGQRKKTQRKQRR